jgi:hypothetical protein
VLPHGRPGGVDVPRPDRLWAKEYRLIPGVVEHVRREMAEEIARFQGVRADLGVDPDDMFVNAAMAEILS